MNLVIWVGYIECKKCWVVVILVGVNWICVIKLFIFLRMDPDVCCPKKAVKLTHSLARSLARPLARPPAHSLTHSLTHSFLISSLAMGLYLPIIFRVASLALGQYCPSACEAILKNMGKTYSYKTTTKHNKTWNCVHNSWSVLHWTQAPIFTNTNIICMGFTVYLGDMSCFYYTFNMNFNAC